MKQPDILFEDEEIYVCRKPAGIAVQTSRTGEQDMVSLMKNYANSAYLGVIHRLDQPVEGILLFARTKGSAALLSEQISTGQMTKIYEAVAITDNSSYMHATSGVLVDYLLVNGRDNTSRVGNHRDKEAKRAQLTYRIKGTRETAEKEKLLLMEICLGTGRHHQIRVQMANAGMPLLGDMKYGGEKSIEKSRELKINKIALCASKLTFRHPISGKEMSFHIQPEGEIFSIFLEDIT